MDNYRKFYTLRKPNGTGDYDIWTDQDGKVVEYNSYEEAFEEMVRIYNLSKAASYNNPTGIPIRYGIWRTTITGSNSMTQPVWEA